MLVWITRCNFCNQVVNFCKRNAAFLPFCKRNAVFVSETPFAFWLYPRYDRKNCMPNRAQFSSAFFCKLRIAPLLCFISYPLAALFFIFWEERVLAWCLRRLPDDILIALKLLLHDKSWMLRMGYGHSAFSFCRN